MPVVVERDGLGCVGPLLGKPANHQHRLTAWNQFVLLQGYGIDRGIRREVKLTLVNGDTRAHVRRPKALDDLRLAIVVLVPKGHQPAGAAVPAAADGNVHVAVVADCDMPCQADVVGKHGGRETRRQGDTGHAYPFLGCRDGCRRLGCGCSRTGISSATAHQRHAQRSHQQPDNPLPQPYLSHLHTPQRARSHVIR